VLERRLSDEVNAFEASKRSAEAGIRTLIDSRVAVQDARNNANARAERLAVAQLLAEEDPAFVAKINDAAKAYTDAVETRSVFLRFILGEANKHGDQSLHHAHQSAMAVSFETPKGNADLDAINARLAQLLTGEEA
jgi:hypothetical protein